MNLEVNDSLKIPVFPASTNLVDNPRIFLYIRGIQSHSLFKKQDSVYILMNRLQNPLTSKLKTD